MKQKTYRLEEGLPQPAALSVLIVNCGHSLEKEPSLVPSAAGSGKHPKARTHILSEDNCLLVFSGSRNLKGLCSSLPVSVCVCTVPVADTEQHDEVHKLQPWTSSGSEAPP